RASDVAAQPCTPRPAEAPLDPTEAEVPQPALADERGHRDEADRRDRRDADPSKDHAERQRQLDTPEDLPRGVAHAQRRVADIGGDAAYPAEDVPDQDE